MTFSSCLFHEISPMVGYEDYLSKRMIFCSPSHKTDGLRQRDTPATAEHGLFGENMGYVQ
jgi:hypothetical protein